MAWLFFSKLSWGNYHKFPILQTLAAIIAAIEFRYIPILGKYIAFPTNQDRLLFKETAATKEAFQQGIKGPTHELKVYTDDWGFKLSDIKAKVFLWYGAKDKCVSPNMGKYYHTQIVGSKLFIDSNGGHLARYKFEEKILKVLI